MHSETFLNIQHAFWIILHVVKGCRKVYFQVDHTRKDTQTLGLVVLLLSSLKYTLSSVSLPPGGQFYLALKVYESSEFSRLKQDSVRIYETNSTLSSTSPFSSTHRFIQVAKNRRKRGMTIKSYGPPNYPTHF